MTSENPNHESTLYLTISETGLNGEEASAEEKTYESLSNDDTKNDDSERSPSYIEINQAYGINALSSEYLTPTRQMKNGGC